MRENLTLIFCVLAALTLVFGKAAQPPDLMHAFTAYQAAVERGDMLRAARYGEITLQAAKKSPLLDDAGIARLNLMVGTAQAKAGNPQRARELYLLASEGFGDGNHPTETAQAKAKLDELDRVIAERNLRGTIVVAPRSGG